MSVTRVTRALGVSLGLAFFGGSLSGCTPEIGDKCTISTDCSTRQDRLCDTSQPEGYCTQSNCSKNGCPDEAACVLFDAAVPGCGYDDRTGGFGSRVSRSFCSAKCSDSSDCRVGYVCANPSLPPWNGHVLDDAKDKLTCLVAFSGFAPGADAAVASFSDASAPSVCDANAPDVGAIDARAPSIQDGAPLQPLVVDSGSADAGDAGDASDGG